MKVFFVFAIESRPTLGPTQPPIGSGMVLVRVIIISVTVETD